MPHRLLARLFARLDRSPLPLSDRVRLEFEAELLDLAACARPRTPLVNAPGGEA